MHSNPLKILQIVHNFHVCRLWEVNSLGVHLLQSDDAKTDNRSTVNFNNALFTDGVQ